jgi:hypothetical protein
VKPAYNYSGKGNGKAIPLQAWTGLIGFQKYEISRFTDNQHMKVEGNGRLNPKELFLVLISVRG